MTIPPRRIATAVLAALLGAAALLSPGPAHAEADGLELTATIDGRDIAGRTGADPVRLTPESAADIAVTLSNGGAQQLEVRRVDLTGEVLGLRFFSYSTSVGLKIAPGKSETLRYELDLAGLDGQATGLIAGRLTVTGTDGAELAHVSTVTDVRGSIRSVYGLFGIALAALTALALLDAAIGIARHRLSANRWQRGVRLLAPGVGIGLVFGFTASVLRWWVPDTGVWLGVAGAAAAIAFVLGYLSPTPDSDPDEPELDATDIAENADTVRIVSRGPIA
ncbi:hypothetical protein AB0H71_02755 [Nocardia sp. NPDC050697]|uniref:hypothetical protein n=1 Tax=Nocardia sp. NPDC050697 TaxID=3155158 RepID=UPI0033D7F7E3